MKRLLPAVLALFFLLQATWLLQAGFDLLMPRVVVAVSAGSTEGDGCCASACGCPKEKRDRGDCCCLPSPKKTAAAAKAAPKIPVSALQSARCRGAEAAMSQASTMPSLCVVARPERPIVEAANFKLPEITPPDLVEAIALDKVPL